MTRRMLLMIGAFACLAGCTMIPKYTRPEAPIPAGWPSGPAYQDSRSPQGAPLASDLQWRDFFTDERLQRIIDTALQNNRDLRVAALNVERARALYRIQRAELLPTVDATGRSYQGPCARRYLRDRGCADRRAIQCQSWHQFLGDRLVRPYPQPGKKGPGGILRHGTGPPQCADPAGVRSCQRLPDPCRGSGKPPAGPIHPRGPTSLLQFDSTAL